MTSRIPLPTTQDLGLLPGFRNLLGKDSGDWWDTRRGLLHLLVWTMLIAGSVVIRLLRDAEADLIVSTYADAVSLLMPVGILIVMQDAIVGERESGTASWLLSKPVSRAAFILSKLTANGMSLIFVMIVVPGAMAYGLVSVAGGSLAVGNWIVGMTLLALNLMSHLSFTLMLGAFFTGRGPIVGLSLGILLAAFILSLAIPETATILPWSIALMRLGTEALLGQSPVMLLPVMATVVWCVLFVAIAIWRFQQEEF